MKKHIVKIWEKHSIMAAILLTICLLAGGLIGYFGIMCLQAWLVMLLWKWIAVGLFGAPILNFWMAFGLCCLCSLLFKSKVNCSCRCGKTGTKKIMKKNKGE